MKSLIRAVLDTNVLVSGLLFSGVPGELVEAAWEQSFRLTLSSEILAELRRVLREKFSFSDQAMYQTEVALRRISTVVEPVERVSIIQDKPSDNRILEAAIAGRVDAIVSGDRMHLLPLRSFQGIPILTPRQFLEKMEKR